MLMLHLSDRKDKGLFWDRCTTLTLFTNKAHSLSTMSFVCKIQKPQEYKNRLTLFFGVFSNSVSVISKHATFS